jgi:H+/gluconate symporter-like permease
MGPGVLTGLLGILIGLGLLIWLAFKGWSVLLLAPIAAVVAAFFSREPLLAHWTQTFMQTPRDFSRSSFRFSCLARYSAN